MSHPFEPTTTEQLKKFLNEYLEENCKSPEISPDCHRASRWKKRNKLIVLNQVLESWRRRQLHS